MERELLDQTVGVLKEKPVRDRLDFIQLPLSGAAALFVNVCSCPASGDFGETLDSALGHGGVPVAGA